MGLIQKYAEDADGKVQLDTVYTEENGIRVTYTKRVLGAAVTRFPIPGGTISTHCPKCNKTYEVGLAEYPAMFPVFNAPFEFEAFCMECSHEFKIPILIEIGVRLACDRDYKDAKLLAEKEALEKHTEDDVCLCAGCREAKLLAETCGKSALALAPLDDEDEDDEYEDCVEDLEDEE